MKTLYFQCCLGVCFLRANSKPKTGYNIFFFSEAAQISGKKHHLLYFITFYISISDSRECACACVCCHFFLQFQFYGDSTCVFCCGVLWSCSSVSCGVVPISFNLSGRTFLASCGLCEGCDHSQQQGSSLILFFSLSFCTVRCPLMLQDVLGLLL